MLRLEIGEVVGVEHQTRYARDGRPVIEHQFRYAVTSPYDGFHLGGQGTFHRMRAYVVETGNVDELAYRWRSLCGQQWRWVSRDGVCQGLSPHPERCAWCHRCESCERLANPEAWGAAREERFQAWWKARHAR